MLKETPNLIILGSGRSGTSMITGLFNNGNFFFGDQADYLKKNKANPKGFFEDLEVNTINEDILASRLINFPEPIRRKLFPSHTFYRARWLAKIPVSIQFRTTPDIQERIEKLVQNEPFCFKDPRFSYTLPIWKNSLPPTTKFIVVYREPDKTAVSICRECSESPPLRKLKMSISRALNIWKAMYTHILKNYGKETEKQKWLFIHYNEIFESQGLERLGRFANTSLEKDFAERKISRTTNTNIDVPKDVLKIYNRLNSLSSYQ
ncbi:sulfotransferase domain-containing protein [Christiangramia flava]|nr:sulfotransferase domain-containing protein [Christiangramia flava]